MAARGGVEDILPALAAVPVPLENTSNPIASPEINVALLDGCRDPRLIHVAIKRL